MFGNGPSILNSYFTQGTTFLRSDAEAASTPQLVRAYTEIKVRVAVHTATTPEVAGRFGPLAVVVDELRKRGALD